MWKEYDLLDEQKKIHCLSPDLLKKIIQKFCVSIDPSCRLKNEIYFLVFLDDFRVSLYYYFWNWNTYVKKMYNFSWKIKMPSTENFHFITSP